ncbi:MAG TPA: hypothetical protein VGH27_15185 [Streptosporangiaceae bacterium]
MPSLAESLNRVMAVEGAQAAALIDIATGMIVQSAGTLAGALAGTPAGAPTDQLDGDFPAAAARLADEFRAARALAGPADAGGDLEEILLVTGGRLQVSRSLSFPFGEGLLLFVDLDRSRVNMALASLRVGQLASEVLAQP